MKNILIINGHPDKDSFCAAQAKAFETAAKKHNHSVSFFHAYDSPLITTNPSKEGFPEAFTPLADAASTFDVIVLCSPLWNFGTTGGLKNFLDGVFQPQKSFRFSSSSLFHFLGRFHFLRRIIPGGFPQGLLKAQKVICVISADSPAWYFRLFPSQNAAFLQIRSFFRFCGVRKIKLLFYGAVRKTTDSDRQKRLSDLESFSF